MTFAEFLHNILYRGLEQFGKFYSSYRGYVVNNEDPEGLNRILVSIPSVTRGATHTKWAFPKNAFSGNGYGIQMLPMVGDLVWIEFEFGNTEYPIWSHAHYAKGEKPEEFLNHKIYGFKSPMGQLVIIDDRENEVYVNLKKADSTQKDYNTPLMAFNKGENGGFVKVRELTIELNKLQEKMNDLLSHYRKHVHIDPISGYTGVPSPPFGGSDLATPAPKDIAITDQEVIEDNKLLH